MANAINRMLSPLVRWTGLTALPDNAGTIITSFVFFTVFHLFAAPILSSHLFPETWKKMNSRTKNQWSNRCAAFAHAVLVVPLAARCLSNPILNKDRAFGWDDDAALVIAIACGYFLWDTLECVVHFVDIGFVAHGVACLAIYALQFRPFLAYYGARCLLWELSTPFLNINWFLDKGGMTGSKVQLINGGLLLSTFAFTRLIWGSLVSYQFFCTLLESRQKVPFGYVLVFGVGNVLLNVLNWYWFGRMIQALARRFSGAPRARAGERNKRE